MRKKKQFRATNRRGKMKRQNEAKPLDTQKKAAPAKPERLEKPMKANQFFLILYV